MKNIKKIIALLLAAALIASLSACEIRREGIEEPSTNNYETGNFIDDDELEGDEISDLLYGDSADYQIWNADNGDIYAFNSQNSFYLKSDDKVYYGVYRMTTSSSTLYYALLEIICDNDSSIDETFNVVMENGDFVLHRASSEEIIVISKNASADVNNDESTEADGSEPASENSSASEDNSDSQSIYEIMGLDIYYLTMKEFTEGAEPVLNVSAAPVSAVKADDGSVSYEYDTENAVDLAIGENTNIYMPDVENPADGSYGCDMYQMKDCFEALGSFYAVVIFDGDKVESVRYIYIAE